jgi:hypothetical protein
MTTITLKDCTSAGLVKAIKTADPGDVILAPSGDYPDDFILDGIDKAGLQIKAQDKRYRPNFTSRFYVKNSHGLTFDALEFSGAAMLDMPVQISGCGQITVSHCYIHGSLDVAPNDKRGMLVRGSGRCLIVQNTFEELSDALGWLDSPGLIIRQNVFRHIADNCMAGGGSVNLEVGGNVGSSFQRVADDAIHPDFIQNWGTEMNPQPTGLLIRGNVYVRGIDAWLSQGVWVSDAKPPEGGGIARYPGSVRIYDNIMIGTIYNGMVAQEAESVDFQRNICLGTADQWSYIGGRSAPENPSNVHFKDNIVTWRYPPPNPYGSGMVAIDGAIKYDDGGNAEIPCITQELAEQLYRDFDEIFVANGSWAVGFYDKYKARVLERLGI